MKINAKTQRHKDAMFLIFFAALRPCVKFLCIFKGITHERRPFTSGCMKIAPPSRQERQVSLLFADLQIG